MFQNIPYRILLIKSLRLSPGAYKSRCMGLFQKLPTGSFFSYIFVFICIYTFIFIYFCKYETIETYACKFFSILIFSVSRVGSQNMQNQCKLCGIFWENLLIDTYDSIVKLSARAMKYTFFCEAVIRFFVNQTLTAISC